LIDEYWLEAPKGQQYQGKGDKYVPEKSQIWHFELAFFCISFPYPHWIFSKQPACLPLFTVNKLIVFS